MKHARALIVLLGMVVCHGAYAVRSGVNDESEVGEAGECQSELVWERVGTRGEPAQRERSVRLTCGIGWHTELELAHARNHHGADRGESLALEAKTALRARSDDHIGWAVALTLGAERGGSTWRRSGHEAAVVATRQLGPSWLAEAKLGTARDVLSRRSKTLWELACEHALNERFELRAELAGDDRNRPLAKASLRYVLWPEHVQLKASYGARSGPQRERVSALGLQVDY